MTSILDKIKMVDFPAEKYYAEKVEKKSIVIHHTASDGNPYGCIEWWKKSTDHVSTPFLIAGHPGKSTEFTDGQIIQLYSSGFWAFHLGLAQRHLEAGGPNHSTNTILNKMSIPIELCNFGGLIKKNDRFYSYDGEIIDGNRVTEYSDKFRGFNYYESYTDAQLESLKKLIIFLGDKYKIDLKWKGMEMFDVNKNALCGEGGVWSHVSYRPPQDKQDCHPQPQLVELLKNL